MEKTIDAAQARFFDVLATGSYRCAQRAPTALRGSALLTVRTLEGAAPVAGAVVGCLSSAQLGSLVGAFAGGQAMVAFYGAEVFRPGGVAIGSAAGRLAAGGTSVLAAILCPPRASRTATPPGRKTSAP